MGAAGVALAAAAAHEGGGERTRIAADFLLIHAGVAIALGSIALHRAWSSTLFLIAAALLVFGTSLFSGELALAALAHWRPFPQAAPIGGVCMMLGWIAAGTAALIDAFRGAAR